MLKDTEQIIKDLYALRAGLSCVSKETDAVRYAEENCEKQIKSAAENIYSENSDYDLEHLEDRSVKVLSVIDGNRLEVLDKRMAEMRQKVEKETAKDKAQASKAKIIAIVSFILFAATGVFFTLGYLKSLDKIALNVPAISTPSLFFITAVLLIVSIVFFRRARSKKIGINMYYNNYFTKLENEKKAVINVNEYMDKMRKNTRNIIEPHKIKGDKLITVLENSYARLLDARDWQYLDLVIFYLETGRADTMKEALLLLEREVQTQRIIGAIEQASARICRMVAQIATVISSQLNDITSRLNTVVMQQQMQIKQNDILIKAADMQNALLEKANVTSEKLLADVKYIEGYKL